MATEHEITELLKKKRDEVQAQLDRLDRALAALSDNQNGEAANGEFRESGVTPPIADVVDYLREHGSIAHQNQIIRAVGEVREKRYPRLSNHYSNVWRALEYHVRHNRLIRCVNEQGLPAELKPLPTRRKGSKLYSDPALYEQDNWFMLKEIPQGAERGRGAMHDQR